jgi:hypothetical protein
LNPDGESRTPCGLAAERRAWRFLSGMIALVGNEICKCVDQRPQIVTKHTPDKIEADVPITVDEAVAHADDLTPWDIGMSTLRGS